jgi:hypothetical protein
MKLLSFLVVFALAFVAACIGILTFLQPALHAPVSIVIFSYKTSAYPVYYIIIGAVVLGVVIGSVLALYYRIRFGLLLTRSNKKISELESSLLALSQNMHHEQDVSHRTAQENSV